MIPHVLAKAKFLASAFIIAQACLSVWPAVSYAATSNHYSNKQLPRLVAIEHQLQLERERNAVAADRLGELYKDKQRQLQALNSEKIEQDDLDRAELDIAMSQADLNAINLTLDDIKQTIDNLTQSIHDLEIQLQDASFAMQETMQTTRPEIEQWQMELDYQRHLVKLQQERIKNLTIMQSIVKKRIDIEQTWRNKLQTAYQGYQHEKRRQDLERLEFSVQREQQLWLEKLAVLNQQMKSLESQGLTDNPAYAGLALQVFEAEERGNLSHMRLVKARLQNQVEELATAKQQAHTITEWNLASEQADTLLSSMKKTQQLLQGKVDLIKQRQGIGFQGKNNGVIGAREFHADLSALNSLANSYQQQLETVTELIDSVHQYRDSITKNLRRALANRQELPGFSLVAWVSLAKKLADMPALTLQVAAAVWHQLLSDIRALPKWQIAGLLGFELIWFGLAWKFRPYLIKASRYYRQHAADLASQLIFIVLELWRQNFFSIVLGGSLGLMLLMSGISGRIFHLILTLAFIWFGFNFTLGLARLSLLETIHDTSGKDVIFYHRLKWGLAAGGLLSSLMVLALQLPVAYEVKDFFNRLFMLFLFVGSLLLLIKGQRIIPELLDAYIPTHRFYLKRVIRLLSLLVPIVLLSNAVIGLIGYVSLAWTMSKYEAIFLTVLSCYLILQGIFKDVMNRCSKILIRRLRNGWLFSEAFLKPLDKVLRIGLFLGAAYVLFKLFGWDERSLVVINLQSLLQQRLFSLAGGQISLLVIIQFIIVLSILVWMVRWSREFAYRWLFGQVKDVGLRNSCAVFTQYTVVTIGLIICLHVLGINLFALTAVAGAFAFGVGLGLRDLANNFASGVLLLLERPLRKGDLVTIGGYEGEVTHIGTRSLTINTSDHTEVMVPNSEAFSKTFTNWTHQDSIVRGVINLVISGKDNPHWVRAELLALLKTIPGIISEPVPEVYFKNIEHADMLFEIHYFINLQITPSRIEMRSKTLFAIWDRCKELGIHMPHRQQDIKLISIS